MKHHLLFGKYRMGGGNGKCRPIDLVCHNGHAWPKDLHFPQSREVHIYEGDVWEAIQQVTQDEPLAVWFLDGGDKQLNVDQFVLQDGRTYRTRAAHQKLQEACALLGDDTTADRAFGASHAASIKAKEHNGWKPTPTSLFDDIQ